MKILLKLWWCWLSGGEMGGGEVGWGGGGWRGIILVWADRWQSIRIRRRGVDGRCPPGPRPPSSSSYHRAAALGMTRCAKMAARRPTVGGILSPCPPVARRRQWAVPPLLLLPSTPSRFPKLVVGGCFFLVVGGDTMTRTSLPPSSTTI